MTERVGTTQPPTGSAAEAYDSPTPRLTGRMGLLELSLTVLAFSGPLAVVVGYVPFVIYFNGPGAPWAFGVATIVLLLFAVGFTTMARFVPNPGGFYAFVAAGLGKPAGLGASFLAILGYSLLFISSYAFFGVFANELVHNTWGGPEIPWWVYGIVGWAIIGVLGYLNIDISAKVLSVVMVLEVAMIMIFNVGVLINGGPEGRSLEPLSWTAFTSGSAVGVAVLFAVTCFFGFEATAIFREEVKQPRKTIPRATYLAVISIGVLYTFSTWIVVTAFGASQVTSVATENPAGMVYEAMGTYVGNVAVQIVSVLMLTSILAAILSGHNVVARYYYSLGVDGILPKALGVVNPKRQAPSRASIVNTVMAAIVLIPFIVAGANAVEFYGRMAATGGFVLLVLLLLTSVAVLVYFRRTEAKDTTVWHTTVAPVLAIVGMVVFVYLAISNFTILINGPIELAVVFIVAVFLVLVAGVVVALFLRSTKPEVYGRIGRKID